MSRQTRLRSVNRCHGRRGVDFVVTEELHTGERCSLQRVRGRGRVTGVVAGGLGAGGNGEEGVVRRKTYNNLRAAGGVARVAVSC